MAAGLGLVQGLRLPEPPIAAAPGEPVENGPGLPPRRGAMAAIRLHPAPLPVPPGSFLDAEDRRHDLAEFKGTVTLVNFWATWCTPCLAELPALDRLARDHGGAGFRVVTIALDHGGHEAVERYFRKLGITALPGDLDPDLAYPRLLHFESLPVTILLDAEGREIARYDTGAADWDGPDAWRFLAFFVEAPARAG